MDDYCRAESGTGIRMTRAAKMLALSDRCPPELAVQTEWCLNDFVLVKKLGVGGASAVYQGVQRTTGYSVALKMYCKAKMTPLNIHQVHREVKIHIKLDHPNIIDLWGAFEDDELIILVIEHAAEGDLFDLLRQMAGRMKESEVVSRILHPFMSGLRYLHKRGIIHRDIKLENTLFAQDGTLKLADFGLSIDTLEENPVTRLGTLDYMSPEVMLCPDKRTPNENKDNLKLVYNHKVDAWACGVLAYELLVGCPPFGMSTREGSVKAIMTQNPKMPPWLPQGAVDFISWALTKSAALRPSVEQLHKHHWILMHQTANMRYPSGPLHDAFRPLTRQVMAGSHSQQHICQDAALFKHQATQPGFPVGVLHVVEGPEHSGCSVRSTGTEHHGLLELSPRSTRNGHSAQAAAVGLSPLAPLPDVGAPPLHTDRQCLAFRPGRPGEAAAYAASPAAHADVASYDMLPRHAPTHAHHVPPDDPFDKLQELLNSSPEPMRAARSPVSCPHHWHAPIVHPSASARPLRPAPPFASVAEYAPPQLAPPRSHVSSSSMCASPVAFASGGSEAMVALPSFAFASGASETVPSLPPRSGRGGARSASGELRALDMMDDEDEDMLGLSETLGTNLAGFAHSFLHNVAEERNRSSANAPTPAPCGARDHAMLAYGNGRSAPENHEQSEYRCHGSKGPRWFDGVDQVAARQPSQRSTWIDETFLEQLVRKDGSEHTSPVPHTCLGSEPNLLATLEAALPSLAPKSVLRRANTGSIEKQRAHPSRSGSSSRLIRREVKRADPAGINRPLYQCLQSCLAASDPASAPVLTGLLNPDILLDTLRAPPVRAHRAQHPARPRSALHVHHPSMQSAGVGGRLDGLGLDWAAVSNSPCVHPGALSADYCAPGVPS